MAGDTEVFAGAGVAVRATVRDLPRLGDPAERDFGAGCRVAGNEAPGLIAHVVELEGAAVAVAGGGHRASSRAGTRVRVRRPAVMAWSTAAVRTPSERAPETEGEHPAAPWTC